MPVPVLLECLIRIWRVNRACRPAPVGFAVDISSGPGDGRLLPTDFRSRAIRPGGNRAAGQRLRWVAGLFVFPAIFLGPVNGALANSLPKRWAFIGSAGFCLAAITAFALVNGAWFWCVALVALGAAVYSPVRYALLPAASVDTRIPLSRVNGLIEMGFVTAVVGGLICGGFLAGPLTVGAETGHSAGFVFGARDEYFIPAAVAAAIGLNLAGVLFAIPVYFRSDVYRPEPPPTAPAGFFRDSKRIFATPEARGTLLALAGLRGLVAAIAGALIAETLAQATAETPHDGSWPGFVGLALWILVGGAGGSLLAGARTSAPCPGIDSHWYDGPGFRSPFVRAVGSARRRSGDDRRVHGWTCQRSA